MKEQKEKERIEFQKKYDRLPDLKKIQIQNFDIINTLKDQILVKGIILYWTMGFLFMMPVLFLLVFSLKGFLGVITFLFIIGMMCLFGVFLMMLMAIRNHKKNKKIFEEFLIKNSR